MRKKFILWTFLLIFFVICLLLILFIRDKGKESNELEEITYFSEDIQEVEIIDGTSGYKVTITESKDLDELQSVFHDSKFITASDAEETTGYKWRIIMKTNNETIDIIGTKNVSYDNKTLMFYNNDDYTKLEASINSLYKKYTTK